MKQIELLAPAGSMANLKAAVSRKADAVYLGMNNFTARAFATNFNRKYLSEAVRICRSNNVRLYLAMNTLVKNEELKGFFEQLSYAYSAGVDAVIIQETSFIDTIRKNYPDLRVHVSTQAGVMNSAHANLLSKADRITLARELKKEEIAGIRKNFSKELEIFCHGALCVSISGQCLFSSLLGGRSGNRGRCAQPCRKKYNNCYYLSTKELCLIDKLPEIISSGIEAVKIEGRMRNPYYVATVTDIYRKAIDSHYAGSFKVTNEMMKELHNAFSRSFTHGIFNSEPVFNREEGSGRAASGKEEYSVQVKPLKISRKIPRLELPSISRASSAQSRLLVRSYSLDDAHAASDAGADIVYLDVFHPDFQMAVKELGNKLFGVTPRIMLDKDFPLVEGIIKKAKPAGILTGNAGLLGQKPSLNIHLDYNQNIFNDLSLNHVHNLGAMPIISPELALSELKRFQDRNFAVLVHGKIRLMTLRHNLDEGWIKDETGARFRVNNIHNGTEVLNGKELGLLGKSSQLLDAGIDNFFVDTEKDVMRVVKIYRNILDGKKIDDKKMKKDYVLGWSYKGAI